MERIIIPLIIFWVLAHPEGLFSQESFGIKMSVNRSIFKDYQYGEFNEIVLPDIGVGAAGLISYRAGNHKIEIQPGLSVFRTQLKEFIRYHFVSEFGTSYFIESPLLYSYRFFNWLQPGIGITNSWLLDSTFGIVHEADKIPYYLGFIGELEFSLSTNLSLAITFRQMRGLVNEGSFRRFRSIGFDVRIRT